MIIKPANAPRSGKGGFAQLVRYMVRAHGTERCTWFLAHGLPGVGRPDDVERGIRIVEAFQAHNHRAKAARTYHMVIAFDPRDRSLEKSELTEVVQRALSAVGFEEHQYVAVRHSDQEHEHVHVAVNRIHPLTFRSHHPRRDIIKLMQIADELEHELGLHVVENRRSRRHEVRPRARDYEGRTGVQSFERWAKQHVAKRVKLSELGSWSELHTVLAALGVRIVRRGNGLAIIDAERNHLATKASSLGRGWSRAQLSRRFGDLIPGPEAYQVIEVRQARYEAMPLRGAPDGLWEDYQEALQKARHARDQRSRRGRERLGHQHKPRSDGYSLRHGFVRALPVSGRDRFRLHRLIEWERRARAAGTKRRSHRDEERRDAPHPGSWLQFLSTRASAGDPRAERRLAREGALPRLSGRGRWAKRQLPRGCFRTSKGSRVHLLRSGKRLFETRSSIRFPTDSDEETLRSALALAKHKFGPSVTMHAEPELQQRLLHLSEGLDMQIRSRGRGD